MRYYKMGRGKYLEDRVDDLKAKVEEYFGEVDHTEEADGVEVFVVEDTMVFESVKIGVKEESNAKDRLAVEFNEMDVKTLQEKGILDEAENAMTAKNEFLKDVTGRTAKQRRESLKRQVEGSDADTST